VLVVTALVVFIVIVAFPWLALAVRRPHDTGRPGYYLLLAYVPFGLIALIWFSPRPVIPVAISSARCPRMLMPAEHAYRNTIPCRHADHQRTPGQPPKAVLFAVLLEPSCCTR